MVGSGEENALLTERVVPMCSNRNGCWIGATDENTEGHFRWVSGERWEYSNWARSEPNNHCGGEHYVHIAKDGRWNDQQLDGGCSGYGAMQPLCEYSGN